MARKSRKRPVKTDVLDIRGIVGYIRLSVTNTDESCSVENQKLIIEQWGEKHKLPINKFYIDKNHSGHSFDRPAFKELLADINQSKISCIVVKDLSRLGREFISTSYFIEEYFPSKKVRFVSINDRFDTVDGINNLEEDYTSRIRVPIINAFNEQMVLETRRKTQEALDAKAKRGMFIGPRAPFGYSKSAENHFELEIDSEAAETVKQIFTMAAEGVAINVIVRYLNETGTLTPILYARSKGLQGNYDDGDGMWTTRSVKYILTNRTYTGVLIQGKEKRVVKGTHAPLIDTKTFDKIQAMLQQRAFKLTDNDDTQISPNILKGKVICGCCGSKMQRRRGTNQASWYFFSCLTNNRVGADHCTGMYVREEDIFSTIYYQLKLYIKARVDFSAEYSLMKAKLEREIVEHQAMLADPIECGMRLYEQFVKKELDKDAYLSEKAKVYEARKYLESARHELEIHERQHLQFIRMQQAVNKEIPLDEIVDYIDPILINEGRQIEVKWVDND